jgi:alkylresorcinol/alkylpyrone synthase
MARLGFDPACRRLPLFGLGCAAGASGIARISEYLTARPGDAAILLSVELCSLTFQLDDASVANIISCALFGDGAACVVLVGDEHPLARRAGGPCVTGSQAVLFPDSERTMGWDVVDTGFRVVLSGAVPEMARGPFSAAVRQFLDARAMTPADVAHWVGHPGGPAVIDAIEQSLELTPGALSASRECLRRVGNLSSASVLVLLAEALHDRPRPSGPGMLFAMGPGFSAELVSLRW